MTKKTFYALGLILAVAMVFEAWYYSGQGHLWPALYYPTDSVIRPITVMQSGGSSLLAAECADKDYISNASDHIIEGVVGSAGSAWDGKNIVTYTDLEIKKYSKGGPLEEANNATAGLTIITPGGCVAGMCQEVEDQPIFHKGKAVRIYFKGMNGKYSIVCGSQGVEDLHWN